MMAAFNRGQPPARQTKVVDSCPSPLKEGRTHKNCISKTLDNDVLPSKSASAGRGSIDAPQGPYNSCTAHKCGKNRCKTCVNSVGQTCEQTMLFI